MRPDVRGYLVERTEGGAVLRDTAHGIEATVTGAGVSVFSRGSPAFALELTNWGRDAGSRRPDAGQVVIEDAGRTVEVRRGPIHERYSVTANGVRQDFAVAEAPAGTGEVRLRLAVRGATATTSGDGARLGTANGRVLTYDHLRVEDARGRTLPARIGPAAGGLEIVFDDAGAVYPVTVDPTIGDANWHAMAGINGVSDRLNAVIVAPSGAVYVGGFFSTAGNVAAHNVAKWDGSAWSALGSGFDGEVYALAVDSAGNLYVGGGYPTFIKKWNGTSWSSMGSGLDGNVYALTLDSTGTLYAGGGFYYSGTYPVGYVAKWNGTSWGPQGFNKYIVHALAVDRSGVLYAGGESAPYLMRWTGTTWVSVGGGMNDKVNGLALDATGTKLYATGYFTMAGTVPIFGAAALWDGYAWHSLGMVGSLVKCIAVDSSDRVYVGNIGEGTIASATGSNSFTLVGGGLVDSSSAMDSVNAIALGTGGVVYAVGRFDTAGTYGGGATTPVRNVAQWDGTHWTAMGSGLDHPVYSLALGADGALYLGGGFTSTPGGPASYIARWSGGTWSPLGAGTSSHVYSIAPSIGGDVYVGGAFTTAGGAAASRIARWNGTTWSALAGGRPDSVNALALTREGGLFAAGFASPAFFDGSAWTQLGSGTGLQVRALAVDAAGGLYAGGDFSTIGGATASRVARWNGSSWSPLGSGVSDIARAIVINDAGQAFVAGEFNTAGGISVAGVAVWDAHGWSAVGSPPERPLTIALDAAGNLFAARTKVSRWDGSSWVGMQTTGADAFIDALAVDADGNLFAAGEFTAIAGLTSAYIARLDLPPSLTLSTVAADPTGQHPFHVMVTATEPVTGLALGDLNVTNGTASGLAEVTPNRIWTVDILPTAPGVVQVGIPVNAVQAASDGNGNFASKTLIRTYVPDDTAPTVTSMVRAGTSPSSASALTFTVKLSEPVFGVDTTDFTVAFTGTASGAVSSVSGSGATYTVTVASVTGDGSLRLDVVSSPSIHDEAENMLVGPYTAGETYVVDHTPPAAPSVTGVTDDTGVIGDAITSDPTLMVSGTAESLATVRLYRAGTILLGTATADGGGAWTVDLSGTTLAEGTHALTATATDAANNSSAASAPLSVTIDRTAPTVVSIYRGAPSPTKATTVTLTVTLDEPVTGLTLADFALATTGTVTGTMSALTGSSASYSVSVADVGGDGTLRLDVVGTPAATDIAGNALAGPHTGDETYVVDHTPPPAPSSLEIRQDLGIAGDGLTADDTLLLCGASEAGATVEVSLDDVILGSTTVGGDGRWCFDHTSTVLASNTYAFAARAFDAAGNISVLSTPYDCTVDTVKPAVSSITRAASSPTAVASVAFTVTFTESVLGVDAADFAVVRTGTAAGAVLGIAGSGASYTVTLTGVGGDGTLRLDVPAGATIIDVAGNDLAGAFTGSESYIIDTQPPQPPVVGWLVPDTGVIGDAVTSDAAPTVRGSAEAGGALTLYRDGGVVLGTATADSLGAWSVDVAALTEGTHHLTATATDAAGNTSPASAPLTITIDLTHPTVVGVTRVSASPTRAASLAFLVLLDEAVIGLTTTDFVLAASGTASGSVAGVTGSGTMYTVAVDGVVGDGSLRLDLVSTPGALDLAANELVGPFTAGESYLVDHTSPTAPSVTRVDDDTGVAGDGVTRDATLVASGTSEALASITLYRAGTIALGWATAGGDGRWTVDATATPLPEGAHLLTAVAVDAAGNASVTSAPLSISVDTTAPRVLAITRDASSPTRATTLTFSVHLSEPVTGLSLTDFALSTTGSAGGALSSLAGSGASYTVSVAAVTGDGALRLHLVATPGGTDLAGNSLAGPFDAGEAYTLDHAAPGAPSALAIEQDLGTPGDGLTADPTLSFCGAAEVGARVEVWLDGEAAGSVDCDAQGRWCLDHTGTVLPDGSHTLTARAVDASGNASALSAPYGFTIDTVKPVVSAIARAASTPTRDVSVAFTVTFSKSVLGLDVTDFAVTRTGTATGTVQGIASSGASYTVTLTGVGGEGTLRLDVPTTATITDLAGNGLAAAYDSGEAYVVDTRAPAPPVITGIADDTGVAGDGVTSDPTLVFSGTSEPGANVIISIADGRELGAALVGADGRWSIDMSSSPLAEGEFSLRAVAVDPCGNRSDATVVVVQVDLTPPGAPSVSTAAQPSVRQPTWSWRTGGGGCGRFRERLDGGPWTDTTATSWSPPSELASGSHLLEVIEQDLAGNWSPPGSATVGVAPTQSTPVVHASRGCAAAVDDSPAALLASLILILAMRSRRVART